jgi:large subunit ribosomal protein L2
MKLWSGKSVRSLTVKSYYKAGHNELGRITVRHRRGGHPSRYRFVDFDRKFFNGFYGVIKRIEYDPNRNVPLALICYENGFLSYILCPIGIRPGKVIASGVHFESYNGNSLPLSYIPPGTIIHAFAFSPFSSTGLARAAGAFGQVLKRYGRDYVMLKIPSGQKRFFHVSIWASIGVPMPLTDLKPNMYFKAGRMRWLGYRSSVRGVAMNPVDHPHGGGQGKTSGGRPSVSPWAILTKGYVTRPKRFASKLIYKFQ